MEKNKVLATGLSGLVGSRIHEMLRHKYSFDPISRSKGVDITNRDEVREKILSSDAEIVLHMAAKTNVDACEDDRPEGIGSEAWYANVYGTQNIADACQESGKTLIYLSTDMVFGGSDTPEGGYTEEHKTHPLNWYALTKFEGEKVVRALTTPWAIMRIAYPYRAKHEKSDFVRTLYTLLREGKPIKAVTDHVFSPTYIDDIAVAFDTFVEKQITGLYHVSGSEAVTPYQAAQKIAALWDFDKNLISEITRYEFFKGKAPRAFDLTLNNDKIHALGIPTKSLTEGLQIFKSLEL